MVIIPRTDTPILPGARILTYYEGYPVFMIVTRVYEDRTFTGFIDWAFA